VKLTVCPTSAGFGVASGALVKANTLLSRMVTAADFAVPSS
jgi:hypothetical protein